MAYFSQHIWWYLGHIFRNTSILGGNAVVRKYRKCVKEVCACVYRISERGHLLYALFLIAILLNDARDFYRESDRVCRERGKRRRAFFSRVKNKKHLAFARALDDDDELCISFCSSITVFCCLPPIYLSGVYKSMGGGGKI